MKERYEFENNYLSYSRIKKNLRHLHVCIRFRDRSFKLKEGTLAFRRGVEYSESISDKNTLGMGRGKQI